MKDADAMNALADLIAEGKSLAAAAKRLGISIDRAQALWMRICAGLGEEA